ncbi:MAG TPA: sugar phosphate nucleotidyltransferase [Bryobacteraceae bacterium]|jgi:mannose-1-phosphate guanylyltransferase|nr:sugar phosphate nucleotidyltransferase [Bryobacteraceae bacterium]
MAEVNQQLSGDVPRNRRWGVLLAGGDGTRLKNLTRFISGDDRPKQFCRLFGDESLLDQARKRAERSISPEQILIPLTRSHRAFYVQESGIRPSQRIVQPANRGTAPPILYSLLSIERIDDDAIVAMLPADHHFSDERAFTAALESAFEVAARHPSAVVLLGASPHGPEVEYGWIEIGPSVHGAGGVWSRVRGFFEKPSFHAARDLLARGSLWNTFVMVGHVRGFLEMVNAAVADLLGCLRGSRLWAGAEVQVQNSLYDRVLAVDFSREVLSVQAPRLLALRMANTGWSDLGHPERVLAMLQAAGLEPWWMKRWKTSKWGLVTLP